MLRNSIHNRLTRDVMSREWPKLMPEDSIMSSWYPDSHLRPESLKQLIKARKVVKVIIDSLQKQEFKDEVGIKVGLVFKGGSMGQETTVPGHHDIDLVLYSSSLNVETVVRNDGYGDLLKNINDYLSRELQLQGLRYRHKLYTKVALKFKCTIHETGESTDVDLLLSPLWKDHDDFLKSLRQIPESKRRLFLAGSSIWQTAFIKQQRQRVRVLIGRAKAWRNMEWKYETEGRPSSYMMSLLVITAFKRLSEEDKDSKCKRAAIATAVKMKALIAEIEEDATSGDLDFRIPGGDVPPEYADLLPKHRLRIVDPANPANNLYLSAVGPVDGGGKWDIFADKIRSFDISKPAEEIMKSYGQH